MKKALCTQLLTPYVFKDIKSCPDNPKDPSVDVNLSLDLPDELNYEEIADAGSGKATNTSNTAVQGTTAAVQGTTAAVQGNTAVAQGTSTQTVTAGNSKEKYLTTASTTPTNQAVKLLSQLNDIQNELNYVMSELTDTKAVTVLKTTGTIVITGVSDEELIEEVESFAKDASEQLKTGEIAPGKPSKFTIKTILKQELKNSGTKEIFTNDTITKLNSAADTTIKTKATVTKIKVVYVETTSTTTTTTTTSKILHIPPVIPENADYKHACKSSTPFSFGSQELVIGAKPDLIPKRDFPAQDFPAQPILCNREGRKLHSGERDFPAQPILCSREGRKLHSGVYSAGECKRVCAESYDYYLRGNKMKKKHGLTGINGGVTSELDTGNDTDEDEGDTGDTDITDGIFESNDTNGTNDTDDSTHNTTLSLSTSLKNSISGGLRPVKHSKYNCRYATFNTLDKKCYFNDKCNLVHRDTELQLHENEGSAEFLNKESSYLVTETEQKIGSRYSMDSNKVYNWEIEHRFLLVGLERTCAGDWGDQLGVDMGFQDASKQLMKEFPEGKMKDVGAMRTKCK